MDKWPYYEHITGPWESVLSPKPKFGPIYKWFKISYLELFFENIITGMQRFYIRPQVPVDIIRVFFLIFRFSSRKSQNQQKLGKKITHFTIRCPSKSLTHFRNLNSLDIENNMPPQHCQKPFWLYKFSSKHVSFWCQKRHLSCTISWRQRTAFLKHFETKWSLFWEIFKVSIFRPT